MVEIKHKDFVDMVPIMPCQNSSYIMGSMICGEGTTQIHASSLTTMDPLEQNPGYSGSILIKKLLRIPRLIT